MPDVNKNKTKQEKNNLTLPLYSSGRQFGSIPLYEIASELTDNLPQGKKQKETSVYYG